ncbi:MAG: hypothetical protein IKS90_06020 [Clostridia bacterium]|nr:hypothetical protein [Clostridia bacterium]
MKRETDTIRNMLNALYKPLVERADALYSEIAKADFGHELRRGFYNGHYRKNGCGEYEKDHYPIPEIELRGLCDIECGFEETGITAKLKREDIKRFFTEAPANYAFELYGVEDWLITLGDQNDIVAAVDNALESSEKEFFVSFRLDPNCAIDSVLALLTRLLEGGFYY